MIKEKEKKADEDEFPMQDITDVCGGFGPWQKIICTLTFLCNYPAACQNLGYAFFTYPNEHWCQRPDRFLDMSVEEWKKNYIPTLSTSDGETVYSQCEMYDSNNTEKRVVTCNKWEYDKSIFHSSIVTQWDLVCADEWKVSVSQSIYMAGFLIAVLVCGQLGDRFGRRPVILFCWATLQIFSTLIAASSSYVFYAIMRFLVAFGASGLYTSCFVLMMEVCEARRRTILGIMFGTGFSICGLILTLLAYLIRDWLYLQLAITLPTYGLIVLYWLMPESPRWLLTQGRREEAMKILERAAEKNGKSVAEIYVNIKAFNKYLDRTESKEKEKKATVLDLLKTPNMRRKTLNLFYSWFVISFVYYGLTLNTTDLGGDLFINFAISVAVEVPAAVIGYFVLKYFGRRRPLAAFLCIGGLACILTIPAKNSLSGRISLAMIGKSFITAAFATIYIYSAEIYPTVVRNVGVGSSSTCARVGSMIAPFVKEMGKASSPSVPLGIFGGLSVISGLFIMLLPETHNKPIPDTIQEGELVGKKIKNSNKDVEQTNL